MRCLLRATGMMLLATLGVAQSFHHYESPLVRGVAVSPDGSRLFVVNTADARISVWSLLDPRVPVLLAEIPVGQEPVAVRATSADEAWVCCMLADAVMVVSVAERRVVVSLPCKDEPTDLEVAGSRVLVSVATNREVVAFDRQTRTRIGSMPVFGDEPRSIVASPDGSRAWVAVLRSGNRTTVVPPNLAPPPPPPLNLTLPPAPQTALIVDADNPTWKPAHGVTLPDIDVVEFNPHTMLPVRTFSAVGTTLFGAALRPGANELWVANTEARNAIRFEPLLRGHVVDNRVTRISLAGVPAVQPFDLNPGIDYMTLPNPGALATALAQPTDCTFTRDGSMLWVASFGTDRVAAVDPSSGTVVTRLEVGTTTGTQVDPRRKKGPRSLAMHPQADVLYVANQFGGSVTIVDVQTKKIVRELQNPYDPTPQAIREGRGFIHDAKLSGNGTMSCTSCHIDGTTDGLAWDLGDPMGQIQIVKDPLALNPDSRMHPMKGPMLTQTLQGLQGTDPYHWRADRTKLQDFNPAFASLLGGKPLSQADIDALAAFVETIELPGNPNQNLDRSLATTPVGTSAAEGEYFFHNTEFLPGVKCVSCHNLGSGAGKSLVPAAIIGVSQDFNVPHLRTIYKRTGKVASAQGRTSGFGIMHDGTFDSVFDLMGRSVFGNLATSTNNRLKLDHYVNSFDTGTAPIVGQALAPSPGTTSLPELDLMIARALAGDCDVIAKGLWAGAPRGLSYETSVGMFRADRAGLALVSLIEVKSAVKDGSCRMLFSAVPPGSGRRLGIDRDLDGVLDDDEGLSRYGQSGGGCTALLLDGNSPPARGNDLFAFTLTGSLQGQSYLLLSKNPAAVPFYGMTQLVDLLGAWTIPMTPVSTDLSFLRLPLPNDASLYRRTIYAQSVLFSVCGPLGFAASSGLKVTFQ